MGQDSPTQVRPSNTETSPTKPWANRMIMKSRVHSHVVNRVPPRGATCGGCFDAGAPHLARLNEGGPGGERRVPFAGQSKLPVGKQLFPPLKCATQTRPRDVCRRSPELCGSSGAMGYSAMIFVVGPTNMMGYSANAIARGKHIFRPQRDLYAPAAPAVRFLPTTTLRGPIGISSSPDETAPQRIALPPTDYK